MPRNRLSPEKWIDAGLDALAASGPAALAAEPLARRLGTTKGSFYWHFKDVPAFQSALIDTWRTRAVSSLAQAVAGSDSPDQRLRTLGRKVLQDRQEAALRIWALSSKDVAGMLSELDTERVTYISLLLRELGLGNRDFAVAMQATLAGLPHLPATKTQAQLAVFDTLVDTVLALSE
ncbi:TetR family transcriptional regulator [Marimonas sp. MJW-29]|uniref:TetR family transcriptional regulator n=1 Tax=Sulfitobacter sediminis TaxID=3234186 RepID=A0ABV3RI93_9RHOB